MDGPWRIRRATVADAGRLVPIERRCFSDPWSIAAFEEILRSPLGLGLVAERGGEVQGYLLARAVAGEGEIVNLAVTPEARRRGLGGRLLEQGVYLRRGFRPVGLRARYYRNPVDDALVLRLALPGGA
jgi:ribosomal-protein-alanine N-acetyltransferase